MEHVDTVAATGRRGHRHPDSGSATNPDPVTRTTFHTGSESNRLAGSLASRDTAGLTVGQDTRGRGRYSPTAARHWSSHGSYRSPKKKTCMIAG